ncbi:oxidoreductase [Actibacterium mucosum KCTC 23349]|uniref:Oxidoreductase n=1 Tax=Actibacterium mucosum KCTC 23349 TaxID=1454373 RepID=A0A037ZFL3_9RHOB|nr:Gfo/Idh/MocA family oxidoreductase [Actibacterium mucosum]KAJ55275.1 oxidoreductase [Actibacterium mucosum KCTC 23349]
MQKPVRWGILGASNFAKGATGPAIHAAKGAKLVALATSSAEKAAGYQAFCPDLKIHSSYDSLLSDPDIDAVYIPLPNHLHVEWALKAMDAGKHVLCEKPVALKAEEIDPLIAKRDETGLLATEAYMIVHHPQWQRTKQLVEDGAIGDLVHVDGVFSFNNAEDKTNIRNRPETGGGALPDIGVYTFGSARWVTGQEPDTLTADITFENDVDVITRVTARFPSFSYNCVISMRMHPRQDMFFHGTEGVIHLSAPFNPNSFGPAILRLHQPNQSIREERFPSANHYVTQFEAFGDSVRNGTPFAWTFEDAKGTQAMIDRAYAAAR